MNAALKSTLYALTLTACGLHDDLAAYHAAGDVSDSGDISSVTGAFTVTGAASPAAGGSVSAIGWEDAKCEQASCAVQMGGTITFEARDAVGYDFTSWSGCTPVPGQPQRAAVVDVAADTSCVASYALRSYRIDGASNEGGTVTATAESPDSCTGSVCTVSHGHSVTFTAVPDPSQPFVLGSWTGACDADPNNPNVAVAANVSQAGTCTALFRRKMFVVSAAAKGPGQVTLSAGGTACSGASCLVPAGTKVQLNALSQTTGRFTGWSCSQGQTSQQPSFGVAADLDVNCLASFVARVTIAWTPQTAGGVRVTGGGSLVCATSSCTVDQGTALTLTATISSNAWIFAGWSSGCPVANPSSAVTSLIASSNYSCIPTFVPVLL